MKRIAWKRGMRLTDDILRASDDNMAELIGKAFVLASVGRFGLIPSSKPFDVSLNISNGLLCVDSLTCLAVTKNGMIIDVSYDTLYSNNFNPQVSIPDMYGIEEYILTINVQQGEWRDTNDGLEEPVYSFSLIPSDSIVPDNAMPIARIVDEYGWRMDDIDFVPPCLFVASHNKYVDLLQQFNEVLVKLDTMAEKAIRSGAHNMIAIFWPLIQQLRIAADKERDLLTPMMLLSNVQKCVSAFTCACTLDENIELSDTKMFQSFVLAPYNYKEAYLRIKTGLKICFSIVEKVEKIADSSPVRPEPPRRPEVPKRMPAPTLPNDALEQECNTSETTIPVIYDNAASTIFFTTDGSTPTSNSSKASKTRDGFKIKFDNGYRKLKGKEAPKSMTIKLLAIFGGENSDVATYTVNMSKALKFSDAIPI